MKIKQTKVIEVEKDVSVSEFVKNLFDTDWNPGNWEDTEYIFRDIIATDYPELSINDIKLIITEAKKEYMKRLNHFRNHEIQKLQNRNQICEWLEDYITSQDLEVGEPGNILTCDEIIDLIIKNGNKI